jgi:predicted Zn-dependent peptidase
LWADTLDRSKAPQAGPAPLIQLRDSQNFTLDNGLKVFVVQDDKLPQVSINLRWQHDPVVEGETAGTIDAFGNLLRRGTQKRDKITLDEEIDFLGATLTTNSSGMFGRSLSKYKQELFALMGEILLQPAFPAEELEKIKKEMLAGLKAMSADANQIADRLFPRVLFGTDHPYGELITEATVANITVDGAKGYYHTYVRPNITMMAIVGDISLKEAKTLAETHFGAWEKAEVPKHSYEAPKSHQKPHIAICDKPGAVQTVLQLGSPVNFKPYSEGQFANSLMNQILGGGAGRRLYNNLREDKGFTYGAYSSLDSDDVIGTFSASAQVRNEVTVDALKAFLEEFNKIRDEKATDKELNSVKATFSGRFIQGLERPQTIARFAMQRERYNLGPDYFRNYLQSVAAVGLDEIHGAAQRVIQPQNLTIVAVGDASYLKKELAEFGDIAVYDVNGVLLGESTLVIPENLTGKAVFDAYLKALGDVDTLKAVKGIYREGSLSVMGMALGYRQFQTDAGQFLMENSMNGQVAVRQVCDGTQAQVMQMGQKQDITGEELIKMKESALPFPELVPQRESWQFELLGAEPVDGRDAFKVKVTDHHGEVTTHYFDAQSYMKVKTVAQRETPMGAITQVVAYKDYQNVDGIPFPTTMEIQAGPQNVTIKVEKTELNPAIPEGTFSLQ